MLQCKKLKHHLIRSYKRVFASANAGRGQGFLFVFSVSGFLLKSWVSCEKHLMKTTLFDVIMFLSGEILLHNLTCLCLEI